MEIRLADKRENIISLATDSYNEIISLGKDVRKDENERTGIQILIREVGTKNLILAKIGSPSENAQFYYIEKAVRSEGYGDYSSQNSEDPERMRFAGCVMVKVDDRKFQASVSGLKSDEDAYIAVRILAYALDLTVHYVLSNIKKHRGMLPFSFSEPGHYLRQKLSMAA